MKKEVTSARNAVRGSGPGAVRLDPARKAAQKRRRIIVTVSIVVVLALAFSSCARQKKRSSEAVGSMKATVSEATVTTGSISTTVSGSGILTDADTQQIVKLPRRSLNKSLRADRRRGRSYRWAPPPLWGDGT